ncbi:MAG: saccharopine dehydrogenase family protein [Actinomycetota bacterium]
MSTKITVLGGAGAVGRVAAGILVGSDVFDEVVIADVDEARAEEIARNLGPKARALRFDADDLDSIRAAIAGSKVVLNTVGPYYRYGPTILSTVAAEGIDYVDVCDDYDATEKMLAMSGEVAVHDVTALIGMGSSPGAANIAARMCAEQLLDRTDSIDIYHAHGGEPFEGRAVIAHRIHSMSIPILVYLDGQYQTLSLFEESGRALEEVADFGEIGTFPVYLYPHPENLTLPSHIKGVKRVTNLGTVLPVPYAELIKSVVRLGLTSHEPIDVVGTPVEPVEFGISYILSRRDALLSNSSIKGQQGCLKIVVKGERHGAPTTYEFSLASKGKGMGEGTGIPAAAGAILMASGKVTGKGVLPPEACIAPADFFALVPQIIEKGGPGKMPVTVKKITSTGTETLDLFG